DWFEVKFEEHYTIKGPRRAGPDVMLNKVLPGYEHDTPADFLITRRDKTPLVVGFARYDSDRGGGQEHDRTGGNSQKVPVILKYAEEYGVPLKILFINDGPGLLAGKMWRVYASLENSGHGRVMYNAPGKLDRGI